MQFISALKHYICLTEYLLYSMTLLLIYLLFTGCWRGDRLVQREITWLSWNLINSWYANKFSRLC